MSIYFQDWTGRFEMNRDSFYFIIVLVMLISMFWNILPGYAASARATVTVTIISSVVVESNSESDNGIKVTDSGSGNYSVTLDPNESGLTIMVNFE